MLNHSCSLDISSQFQRQSQPSQTICIGPGHRGRKKLHMYFLIPINVKALVVRNSISRSPLRLGFLLIPLALAWFALSPTLRAVTPAPDGGYPGFNTAEGQDALFSLTTGVSNTAIGFDALYFNTTGFGNMAIGDYALYSNTIGSGNTANGSAALKSNTTGSFNTATGFDALFYNTTGYTNTATGFQALINNTTGFGNTANGYYALYSNTIGNNNTANGNAALPFNTTGSNNTAIGFGALPINTTGSSNIAMGFNAGTNLTTGSNNIDIGHAGVVGESSRIRIGTKGTHKSTFIAGINGVTVAGGVGVIIDSTGHLGTVVSSERFKDEIKPMDKASEAILALQPVTFRYKHELDPDGIPQFGLVAEQVEKVNPDLVARDDQGKPYTVRYEAVNAMLLNEFLKEHRKVEEQGGKLQEQAARMQSQDRKVQELEATVAKLQAAFKEQASQIQKVSDQLEADRATQQLAANNQ